MASKDELAPFVLKNVKGLEEASKHQPDGSGAYGVLYRVTVNDMPYIAKRLHAILLTKEVLKTEKTTIQQKFRNECILLSTLRHPNIVHFVGVCTSGSQGDLSLIMERLHTDLDKYLESRPNIPLQRKLSILLDVSHGLFYLHSLKIIHRDLTAPNVLLTRGLRAKIADLGVSKLLPSRALAEHTKVPGQAYYMPPEAMQENAKYDSKLDIFSFGHLSTYVASQKFPDVFDVDIKKPENYKHVQKGTLQILRRQKALKAVGEDHCLYPLVTTCLLDEPSQRPTTEALNKAMIELTSKHCDEHDAIFDMIVEENKQLKERVELQKLEFEDALSEAQRQLRELKATSAKKNAITVDEGVNTDPSDIAEEKVSDEAANDLQCKTTSPEEKRKDRKRIRSRTVHFTVDLANEQHHEETLAEPHKKEMEMIDSLKRHVQMLKAKIQMKHDDYTKLESEHQEYIQLLSAQAECDKLNSLSDLKNACRERVTAERQLKQLQRQWAVEKDMFETLREDYTDLRQQNQELRDQLARVRTEAPYTLQPEMSVLQHRPADDDQHCVPSSHTQPPQSTPHSTQPVESRSKRKEQPLTFTAALYLQSTSPSQSHQASRRVVRTDTHTVPGRGTQDSDSSS